MKRFIINQLDYLSQNIRRSKIQIQKEDEQKILKYFEKLFKINLAKVNDKLFFNYLNNNKNEESNKFAQKCKFFFANGSQNDIDKEELEMINKLKLISSMFFSERQEVSITPDIYQLLVCKEDNYISSLQNLIDFKNQNYIHFLYDKFIMKHNKKIKSSILDFESYSNSITNIICIIKNSTNTSLISADNTVNVWIKELEQKVIKAKNMLNTFTEIEEIDFIKEPYFNLLFSIYQDIRNDPILQSSLQTNNITLIYKSIHQLFETFLLNPFILPLFVSESSLKIISCYNLQTNTYFLNQVQVEFYFKVIEASIKLNYPLDLNALMNLICNNSFDLSVITQYIEKKLNKSKAVHIKQNKEEFNYEDYIQFIYLKLRTINNIMNSCTQITLMTINDMALKYLTSLNFMIFFKYNYFKFSQQEQKLILEILQIIHRLNDYHYFLLPLDKIINDNIKNVIKALSEKLADPFEKEDKSEINNAYILFNKIIIRNAVISPFEVKPGTFKYLQKNANSNNSQWELSDSVHIKLIDNKVIEEEKETQKILGFGKLILNKTKLLQEKKEQSKQHELYLLNTIEPLIINLENFRLHCQSIENNPNDLFCYFEELILIPTVYLLYDLIYFSNEINSNIKYLCYKIIYLFFNCYKYLTSVIIRYYLPSRIHQIKRNVLSPGFILGQNLYIDSSSTIKKTIQILKHKFILPNQNEELEIFFQNLHDSLEIDLLNIDKTPLDLSILLRKLSKYTSFLTKMQFLPKIKLNEYVFFSFENKQNIKKEEKITNKEEIETIQLFIQYYNKQKEDNTHNCFLNYFKNGIEEQSEIYNLVIKDILNKLIISPDKIVYNDYFFSHFTYINKLFIANPTIFQNYLHYHQKQNNIIKLISSQLSLIYQYTIIDYHKLNDFNNEQQYKANDIFVSLLEFIRLLCENHNQKMQMILANENVEDTFKLIYFIVQVPLLTQKHYNKSINRGSLAKFFKNHDSNYFKPLLSKIMDFNIELIQGSLAGKDLILNNIDSKNKKQINNCEQQSIFNSYFQLFLNSAVVAYESCQDSNNMFYLSQFLRFIVCFLEEPANDDEIKRVLISYFNGNRVIDFMVFCMKELYLNLPNKTKLQNTKDIDYINELLKGYIDHHDYFNNNSYFTISFMSFKYLKLASYLSEGSRINVIMKEAHRRFKENDQIFDLWSEITFRFFFQVIKVVELSLDFNYFTYGNKSILKQVLIHNIFLVHPDVQLVKQTDYTLFFEQAPFEDQNLKLGYFLKYVPKLEEIITTRKLIQYQLPFVDLLSQMNYKLMVQISAIITLITTFLICFSSSYSLASLDGLPLIEEVIKRKEHNTPLILLINLSHIFFLCFASSNWLYFNIYVLTKTTKGVKTKFVNCILSACTGIQFFLFWNLLFGVLALFPVLRFCHSFQLFALFGLFDTMKTVLISVKLRYKQFISAALLIIIFCLFFASVKYSLFCFNNSTEICSNFSFSFLNLIYSGIRAGSNLGFDKVSIIDNNYYWYFIIEWIFYFILILVMLNIINGIIVDTFQEQREKNNERNQAKENICYICNTGRSYFEKKGINYEDHINYTHSIIHYFEYIVSLKRINELDLNSLDSLILNQLKENQTAFFPPMLTKED